MKPQEVAQLIKKDPATMTRIELINALRSYAHPTWYHELLTWTTPALRALTLFYKSGGTDTDLLGKTERISINIEIR